MYVALKFHSVSDYCVQQIPVRNTKHLFEVSAVHTSLNIEWIMNARLVVKLA